MNVAISRSLNFIVWANYIIVGRWQSMIVLGKEFHRNEAAQNKNLSACNNFKPTSKAITLSGSSGVAAQECLRTESGSAVNRATGREVPTGGK